STPFSVCVNVVSVAPVGVASSFSSITGGVGSTSGVGTSVSTGSILTSEASCSVWLPQAGRVSAAIIGSAATTGSLFLDIPILNSSFFTQILNSLSWHQELQDGISLWNHWMLQSTLSALTTNDAHQNPGHHQILTTIFPEFSPRSIPRNASTLFSIPSTTVSSYTSLSSANHWPTTCWNSWLASRAWSDTMKPWTRSF